MASIPPNNKPCPHCDSLNTKKRTDEVEWGSPLNQFSRGLEAPRYRMKEVTALHCLDCGYDEQYNKNPSGDN
jgi:predicted nucleic-acid-binding Zn-ribbon protein